MNSLMGNRNNLWLPNAGTHTHQPASIKQIIQIYTQQSNYALFPAARFNATRTYVNNVSSNVTSITGTSDVHDVITHLVTTSLVDEEARVMLQDYLVSDEVSLFIRRLIQVNR